MKNILNFINSILGVISYGSGMTLVVIGLSSGFSVLELVLIATCTAILHIGLSETLKRMNNKQEEESNMKIYKMLVWKYIGAYGQRQAEEAYQWLINAPAWERPFRLWCIKKSLWCVLQGYLFLD